MAQKFMAWLLTEKGRSFTFNCVFVSTISVCSAYAIPNTFLLDKYKEIVGLYRSGVPVKVAPAVMERFNKAVELLELSEFDKKLIKPFTVFGFDIFNAGTAYSRFGGIVGIPINFSCNSVDDIQKSDILINGESVNWNTDAGVKLLESLIVSEKAQIFAIAREISTINSVKLFLNTFYSTSVIVLMYGLGNNLNTKFNFYARPFGLRASLYSIISIFGYGFYSLLTDVTQTQCDLHIDRDLCEKSPIFIEGGKEFYEKTIERNIALRKLMGSSGERKYSALGNENFLIRQKQLPLLARKEFFANKLSETL